MNCNICGTSSNHWFINCEGELRCLYCKRNPHSSVTTNELINIHIKARESMVNTFGPRCDGDEVLMKQGSVLYRDWLINNVESAPSPFSELLLTSGV